MSKFGVMVGYSPDSHGAMIPAIFATYEEAEEHATSRRNAPGRWANVVQLQPVGAKCPDDGNLLASDGVCGFCGNAPSAFSMPFNVWQSGTLWHAQAADDCEFFTSVDQADALAQAGYDTAQDTIIYERPCRIGVPGKRSIENHA